MIAKILISSSNQKKKKNKIYVIQKNTKKSTKNSIKKISIKFKIINKKQKQNIYNPEKYQEKYQK